jgi:hypothetical protein
MGLHPFHMSRNGHDDEKAAQVGIRVSIEDARRYLERRIENEGLVRLVKADPAL